VPVDPARQAVRRDLADIRLAEYVFAPHYAAPLPMTVTTPVPLRAGPEEEAPVIAQLDAGDSFDALDFSRGRVWGRSARHELVGYVRQDALAQADDGD
jgi:Bacterial dipeptidyl-peptidase Sh3 domain